MGNDCNDIHGQGLCGGAQRGLVDDVDGRLVEEQPEEKERRARHNVAVYVLCVCVGTPFARVHSCKRGRLVARMCASRVLRSVSVMSEPKLSPL